MKGLKGISNQAGLMLALVVVFVATLAIFSAIGYSEPIYTDYGFNFTNETNYSSAAAYKFSSNWTNTTADGENVTLDTNTNFTLGRPDGTITVYNATTTPALSNNTTTLPVELTVTFTQDQLGPAGIYNFSFGIKTVNASSGTETWTNVTPVTTFSITNASNPVNLYLNGTLNANNSYTYPQAVNATGTAAVGTVYLYRNDAQVATGASPRSENVLLGNGTYAYKVNATGNQNYSDNSTGLIYYALVNQGTPDVQAFIDDGAANKTVTYPTSVTVKGNSTTTITPPTFNLYVSAATAAGNPATIATQQGVGTYQVVYNTSGNGNWTAASNSTIYLQVDQNTTNPVNLYLNGTLNANNSYTYPEAVNATGAAVYTDSGTLFLYRDGAQVATGAGTIAENILLGNATYVYKVNITGNTNYSDNSTGLTFYALVNKGTPDVKTYIDEIPTNKTVTYPTTVTISGNSTTTTTPPTFTLYIGALSNSSNPATIATQQGVSTYQVVYNTSGNGNWTAASNSTIYLQVDQNTSTANFMNLTINDTESNKTYTYGNVSNATGWNSIPELTFNLYKNAAAVGADYDVGQLGVGTYVYIYNTSGNANYSTASKNYNLTVNQASVPLTFLINGTDGNKQLNESATDPTVVANFTAVGTFAGVNPATYLQLWTNYTGADAQWTNGSAPTLANVSTLVGLGVYNWTAVWPGDANYSSSNSTHYLTIADVTNPAVNLGSPGNYTGSGSTGVQNTSTGNLSFTPFDLHLLNCSLYANFTGSWALNQTRVAGTNLTNNSANNFSVTLSDGIYIWNVRCFDTTGNNAYNATNYTLRVATPPIFRSPALTLNDTDSFYSNCTNNNVIHLVANLTQASLTVTANFSAVENNASAVFAMTDAGSGVYTYDYTVTNTTGAFFDGRNITVNATNVLGLQNITGTAAIIYNFTVPTGLNTTTSTNFCNVTNFAAIPGLTFDKTGYGKIVFIDNVNLSTAEQGAKLANLPTALNITNKTIGINSTYFSELQKNATLYMYGITQNLTANLTYIPEGSTEPQVCTGSVCVSPSWNNTTSQMIFNITTFSTYLADDTAPTITSTGPSGNHAFGTSLTLTATTNERATCRYATSDAAFGSMSAFTSSNSTSHSTGLGILVPASYTYYIRCQDIVNNTNNASSTATFTVLPPITGGGGIAQPPATAPEVPTATETIPTIAAGATETVSITAPELPVTEIALTAVEAVSNVDVTVTSSTTQPANIAIAAPGAVHSYLNIETTAPAGSLSQVQIGFKVEASWLTANGLDPSSVSLNHYVNGQWEPLPTSQVRQEGGFYYFTATSPGLSYFAITAAAVGVQPPAPGCPVCALPTDWSACAEGTQTRTNYRCSADTNYTCEAFDESQTCEVSPAAPVVSTDIIWWGALAVIVVIAVGYSMYANHRRKRVYHYKLHKPHHR